MCLVQIGIDFEIRKWLNVFAASLLFQRRYESTFVLANFSFGEIHISLVVTSYGN
jgi:hypothetical protein